MTQHSFEVTPQRHRRKHGKRALFAELAAGSKTLADVDAKISGRYRRNALALFVACAAGLAPWTIFLAITLPPDYHAHHWGLVWAGFDVLLFAATATTAYLGWRRRQAVVGAAIVTATLLICDAWFDVSLDLGTHDIWGSLASALFVELPLAGFILRRAYFIMKLSLLHIYPALGYADSPPPLHKVAMLAFEQSGAFDADKTAK